ncbi:MAG TPA: SDR family oxidoreductase [Anaerolineales bacterium]|nr:SDR family oxidoreductase [Anaerolineales bacterium]
MDLGLKDKAVLVTAASKGLGKAAALEFARQGARVGICARSEVLEATADEIRRTTGAEVLAVRADLTKAEDVQRLVAATTDRFGALDILLANCGGPPPGGFLSLQPEDWEAGFRLIVMSVVYLCLSAIPQMLKQAAGSIVVSESYSVKQPIPNLVLSNSLRLAVIGLVKSLAEELGPKGIRVNSINPSWVWTERVQQIMADRAERNQTSVEEESAKIRREIPLGRMGSVEEYARAAVWLASPAASFVHGHALMLDGGTVRATL